MEEQSELCEGCVHDIYKWIPETVSPAVKRPGREADHLPPSCAAVKNE